MLFLVLNPIFAWIRIRIVFCLDPDPYQSSVWIRIRTGNDFFRSWTLPGTVLRVSKLRSAGDPVTQKTLENVEQFHLWCSIAIVEVAAVLGPDPH